MSPEVLFPGGGALDAGPDDGPVAAGGVRYSVRRFRGHCPAHGGRRQRREGGEGADQWPVSPPVLLLHDVAGGLGDWDVLAGEIAADRAALAVSPKGLGASEDRDPYSAHALAGELAALVLHTVDGPVDVVGHGTGATLAWNLAAQRPDLVRRVVLISGGRALAPWTVAWLVAGAALARGRARAGSGGGGSGGGWAGGSGGGWAGGSGGGWAGGSEAVRRGRIRAAYAHLEPIGRISPQRALVLWGTRDTVSSLAMAQRIVNSLTRTVRPATVRMTTLPGAGHDPLAEMPRRCATLVAEFLRSP